MVGDVGKYALYSNNIPLLEKKARFFVNVRVSARKIIELLQCYWLLGGKRHR